MDLDAEIDRLYGLPLDEFVDARAEAARTLRADGDREGAGVVAKLRKPTVGAWALNQAVRIRRGERDELRAAIADERRLAAALADAAEAIATEAGRSGPALKERVRATLHAAAADDEARDEVARGRVVKEREGGGFGGMAFPSPSKKRKEPPKPKPKVDREQAKRVKIAEQAVAAAHGALTDAKAAADTAAEAVVEAKEALAKAQATEKAARQTERERAREVARRERELEQLQR